MVYTWNIPTIYLIGVPDEREGWREGEREMPVFETQVRREWGGLGLGERGLGEGGGGRGRGTPSRI